MKELVDQVVARVGVSPQQAQEAITTVVGFLKGKLPGPLADQLENFVNHPEGTAGGSPLDAAKDALDGFFGKKVE